MGLKYHLLRKRAIEILRDLKLATMIPVEDPLNLVTGRLNKAQRDVTTAIGQAPYGF